MKAGAQFEMSKSMNEKLESVGDKNGCGACVLKYLGFPERIVNEMILQSHYEDGLDDLTLLEKIHNFEKSKNPEILSQLLYIGLDKKAKTLKLFSGNYDSIKNKLNPIKNDEENYHTNIESVLRYILSTIEKGYAIILNIYWSYQIKLKLKLKNETKSASRKSIVKTQNKNTVRKVIEDYNPGHWTILAKDLNDVPYIIESQNANEDLWGIHKGFPKIIEYLSLLTDNNIDCFGFFFGGHNFKNEELNISRSMKIDCTCLPRREDIPFTAKGKTRRKIKRKNKNKKRKNKNKTRKIKNKYKTRKTIRKHKNKRRKKSKKLKE